MWNYFCFSNKTTLYNVQKKNTANILLYSTTNNISLIQWNIKKKLLWKICFFVGFLLYLYWNPHLLNITIICLIILIDHLNYFSTADPKRSYVPDYSFVDDDDSNPPSRSSTPEHFGTKPVTVVKLCFSTAKVNHN